MYKKLSAITPETKDEFDLQSLYYSKQAADSDKNNPLFQVLYADELLSQNKISDAIISFKLAMLFVLITSLLSYLFFIMKLK